MEEIPEDQTNFHPTMARVNRLYPLLVKALNAVPDSDSQRKVSDYLLGAFVAEQEIGWKAAADEATAAERERCAKVAEAEFDPETKSVTYGQHQAGADIAATIRSGASP